MKSALYHLLLAVSVATFSVDASAASSTVELESPRLTALLKDVRAIKNQVLENFWRDISKQGTPLVESIPGEPDHVLLTFLWRGDEQTKNVVLFSVLTTRANMGFSTEQLARSQLTRLPRTDVWYRTFTIRHDVRLSYYFSPNDPLLPASRRTTDKDWETLQPDPLNPNRFVLAHKDRDWVSSTVDLPGATSVPWIVSRPDIRKGRTEMHRLPSTYLQNERRFWVYTPPGYSLAHEPYSLLVLFDGWTYAHMIPTSTILENLLAADQMDPTIVVMVDQRDRGMELGCYEPFNEFLVRELIPWLRVHYHVTANPTETIVGGESKGGLAAVCAGWQHPDIFGNVLSLSGYFSWDPLEEEAVYKEELEFEWIIRQLAASPKVDVRLVLSVGTLEHDHDFPYISSFLQANRHMRDVLLAKGYEFTYIEVAGGHDIYSNALALPANLIAMANHIRAQKRADP